MTDTVSEDDVRRGAEALQKWAVESGYALPAGFLLDHSDEIARAVLSAVEEGKPRQDWIEFRPDEEGNFDEIVARFDDGMVHAEMMSDKSCYVGFYWDDGRYCQWWIHSKKKLGSHHEHGRCPSSRFTAHGVDRKPELASPLPEPPEGDR